MASILPLGQDRRVPRTLHELLDGLGDAGSAACVVRNGAVEDEAVTGTLDGERPGSHDPLVMTCTCSHAVRGAHGPVGGR
jgi:hypothetical protein